MSFIDMVSYRRACKGAEEGVDYVTLMEAIFRIYEMWLKDKDERKKIDFHSYFGLTTLELGIEDLFEAKKYRKAFAAYFQPRALMKQAALREFKQRIPVKVPENNVEFANSMRVRIRINEAVSLEFEATRYHGPLSWRHVDECFKVIRFGEGIISDEDRHHARKQALQVLNSVRERTNKKSTK